MNQKKTNQKANFKSLIALAALLLIAFIGGKLGLLPGTDGSNEAIIAPQAIADYIFAHGELPDNFITKKEAQALGWDSSENYVSDVAPGKSIGGDRFGNYEELLPTKSGRTWTEADANYVSGPRGAERIVFSSDGLVYYTDDHYESFTKMERSE